MAKAKGESSGGSEVGLAQLAKALNLTPQRVNQLVPEGMPRSGRGRYPLGECMAWYIRYLQAALKNRSTDDGSGKLSHLTSERIATARAQREAIETRNAQARGELVLASDVREVLDLKQANLKEALRGLPSRFRKQLEGLNGQAIEDLTREELDRVLEMHGGFLGRLAASLRARAGRIDRGDTANRAPATTDDGNPVGGTETDPAGGQS